MATRTYVNRPGVDGDPRTKNSSSSVVVKELGNQLGMQLFGGMPEELAALIKREIRREAELVKISGAIP